MPRISVIIPTYNRAAFLAEAIQSVRNQGRSDIEIIVADDGSTDNTAEVARQFESEVVYLSLSHRGQPAAARNAALSIARGEFIAFLDSDDVFLPDKLTLQVATLEAHPEVALVYSNGYFFRETSDRPIGFLLDGLPSPYGDVFAELLRGNFVFTPAVLVRRACLDAVGFFDESVDLIAVEDYELWLRMAAHYPFVYAPRNVTAVRRHDQSISRDIAALHRRELCVLAKMDAHFPTLMKKHRQARHEAYARNHGAVARAELAQAHIRAGLDHGLRAVGHALRMPGLGLPALSEWQRRRRLRERAVT